VTDLQRNIFLSSIVSKSIDLDKVEQALSSDKMLQTEMRDSGLDIAKLRHGDSNHDGKLDSNEAWKIADDLDHNGSSHLLISSDPNTGQPTSSGRAATTLETLFKQDTLQPDKAGNDGILYVGMNEYAHDEAKNLKDHANGHVNTVVNSRIGEGKVKVGRINFDLNTEVGRKGFVATLGLPKEQSDKIEEIFNKMSQGDYSEDDPKALDEMAKITQVWAKGERGEQIPSRMVLSGHHVGSGVYDHGNGKTSWDALKDLSKAMPQAAAQVEDINFSACYAYSKDINTSIKEIFPNVKTRWLYSESAPGTWNGAMDHLEAWEGATRGNGQNLQDAVNQLKSQHVRKADNVYVETDNSRSVYNGPSLDVLRNNIRNDESLYREYFNGERVDENHNGPLRGYYNQIHSALQHPDLPTSGIERHELERQRNNTIRLIYFSNVVTHFEENYDDQVKAGYAALGLPAPNFSGMTCHEAVETIRNFQQRVVNTPNSNTSTEVANTSRLLNGLLNLDTNVVPNSWI
jgi:hypothetical protein